MPRGLSAGNAAAATAGVIRPVHLAELDFASGFTRLASAPFSVYFDSDGDLDDEEFLGGFQVSVSAIEETTETKAAKIRMGLTGVNAAVLSLALTERYQGRRASLWRGFLDPDYQLVAEPHLIFRGLMDTLPIRRGSSTATVGVTVVNRFARWERGMDSPRRDDADHQSRRPGDLFFQYVPQLVQGQEINWGRG